jgi:hypothetical protein
MLLYIVDVQKKEHVVLVVLVLRYWKFVLILKTINLLRFPRTRYEKVNFWQISLSI